MDQAAAPPPQGDRYREARVVWPTVFAAITGIFLIACVNEGAWTAVPWLVGSIVLIGGITPKAKAWRTRHRFFVPGLALTVAAFVLLFSGMHEASTHKRQKLEREFAATGSARMEQARTALRAGDAAAAKTALEPIADIETPQVQVLKIARAALHDAGGDRRRAARALYSAAAKEPQRREAAEVLDPDEVATLDAEAAKTAENDRLAAHFSKWDGSHPAVVEAVKAQMHDPSSFKHVSTTAKGRGDTIIVSMTYRGTNAFGGVVTNQATAVVDADGELHSIVTGR